MVAVAQRWLAPSSWATIDGRAGVAVFGGAGPAAWALTLNCSLTWCYALRDGREVVPVPVEVEVAVPAR
jgi:hypothetical protein